MIKKHVFYVAQGFKILFVSFYPSCFQLDKNIYQWCRKNYEEKTEQSTFSCVNYTNSPVGVSHNLII